MRVGDWRGHSGDPQRRVIGAGARVPDLVERLRVEHVFGLVIRKVVTAVRHGPPSRPQAVHSLAAVALLTLIAACSGTAATPLPTLPPTAVPTPMPSLSPTATPEPVYTITGSLSLTAISGWTFATGGCISKGSYDDIRTGTDVTVKDQTGTIIAAGRLEPGDVDVDPLSCKFPFTIADVSTATFYAIEVGHRGALTYSFNELRGRGWRVDFTLGD